MISLGDLNAARFHKRHELGLPNMDQAEIEARRFLISMFSLLAVHQLLRHGIPRDDLDRPNHAQRYHCFFSLEEYNAVMEISSNHGVDRKSLELLGRNGGGGLFVYIYNIWGDQVIGIQAPCNPRMVSDHDVWNLSHYTVPELGGILPYLVTDNAISQDEYRGFIYPTRLERESLANALLLQ